MKRLVTLTAAFALTAGLAQAQVVPGQEFMTQWDTDSDGQVTLAEAREHRADIFAMFDSDDNGSYSADEIAGIDEHKLMEIEAGMGPGHQMPEGMQPGQGMGPGGRQGQGFGPGNQQGMGYGPGGPQGKGMGNGPGAQQRMAQAGARGLEMPAADGLRMFDADRDGTITRTEFVNGTDAWFQMRDMNGDGVLTTDDFGPRR